MTSSPPSKAPHLSQAPSHHGPCYLLSSLRTPRPLTRNSSLPPSSGSTPLLSEPARRAGSGARGAGKMALDGPEQVRRRRWPGGDRGRVRSRKDPRWAAGLAKRVEWARRVGGGWSDLDWALPETGSAVSAPPRQVRAGPGEEDTVEAE